MLPCVLWHFRLAMKLLVIDDKITASCPTNMPSKHYIKRYEKEKKTEKLSDDINFFFQNPQLQSVIIFIKLVLSCPCFFSIPLYLLSLMFWAFFFARFTIWVTVPTVRILIQPVIRHTVISKSMKGRIRKEIVHQILLICTTSNVRKTVWGTCKLIIDFNQLCSLTKLIHTILFLKTNGLFYE